MLIRIFYSYNFVPIDQVMIPFNAQNIAEFIILAFNKMFIIAFQMSLPVVGTLFLVDVALGIVARTVPQLNIFVVGLPVKIGVSFIVLIAVMGVLIMVTSVLFSTALATMRGLMELIGGV